MKPLPNHHTPLDELLDNCLKQLKRFESSRNVTEDTSHCLEIVRRACLLDMQAFETLYKASQDIVQKLVWRFTTQQERDEFGQDVLQSAFLRLLRRAQKPEKPLVFVSFPQYRRYLKVTVWHVITDLRRGGGNHQSLEDAAEMVGDGGDLEERISYQELRQKCLDNLSDPLEREIFVLSYVHGWKPEQIIQELKPIYPDIDESLVFRKRADAKRRIKTRPEYKRLQKDYGQTV